MHVYIMYIYIYDQKGPIRGCLILAAWDSVTEQCAMENGNVMRITSKSSTFMRTFPWQPIILCMISKYTYVYVYIYMRICIYIYIYLNICI